MYLPRLYYIYQFSVKTKHVICFVILIIKACCCVFLFVLHSTKLCVPNRHQKTGTPINCTKVFDLTVYIDTRYTFLSNHNIHKSLCGLFFGLQTLWLIDFSVIFQLKGLKPKNKDHTNLYESCDLMKKSISTGLVSIPVCNCSHIFNCLERKAER